MSEDQKPTFDVYVGQDGVVVVHVDTSGLPENDLGPIIRIYLNDDPDPLFENK